MKSINDIMQLIGRLDQYIADDFEDQDLDFKQWSTRSIEDNINKMIEYAICMTNGGGGSVVFGIADRIKGYDHTIIGVPLHLDIEEFKNQVEIETVPSITPTFHQIKVSHGTGEILIMTVHPSRHLHTMRDGKFIIRKGKECLTMTEPK